ncbi:MAG TPA: hypothetical protein DCR04_12185, partial [Flavobacteriales bacterium]|nr:hypothetical protein [Flavobacteriales bacterium]
MKNILQLCVFGLSALMITPLVNAQIRQTGNKTSLTSLRATIPQTVDAIIWDEPVTEVTFDGSSKTYLFFKGAVFLGEESLPHVVQNLKVSSNSSIQASLRNLKFEALSNEEKEAVDGITFPSSVEVKTDRYIEMKQAYVRVSFVPIRKNPTTGQLEKLVDYELEERQTAFGQPKVKAASNAATSVLATGNWYKIAVSQDGLYRITRNDLEAMGMDVNAIDPRRLNVYGNGGSMLPQANSAFRHDDLQQNAIEVVGEADGSFDANDYIVFYAKGPHSWVQDSSVCGLFRHEFNVYSDKAYYFITADRGMGR